MEEMTFCDFMFNVVVFFGAACLCVVLASMAVVCIQATYELVTGKSLWRK